MAAGPARGEGGLRPPNGEHRTRPRLARACWHRRVHQDNNALSEQWFDASARIEDRTAAGPSSAAVSTPLIEEAATVAPPALYLQVPCPVALYNGCGCGLALNMLPS